MHILERFLVLVVFLSMFSALSMSQDAFCDSKTDSECIIDTTHELSPDSYGFSSVFVSQESAVMSSLSGRSNVSIFNVSFISGLWRGSFNISTNGTKVEPGAEFKPKGGDIVVGTSLPGEFPSEPSGCSDVSGSSGVYTIDPDGDGGVSSFEVYCEMSENGGGWIKLRLDDEDHDANSDSMLWFSKYDTVSEQRSTHGSIGQQFDWGQLDQLSSEDDLDPEFSPNYEELTNRGDSAEPQTNKRLEYEMAASQDTDYTDAQINAIREHINNISSTTRMFTHTNDDDNCDPNGEVYIRLENGGSRMHVTPYTSGNQVSYSRYWDESDFQNTEYLLPTYIDYGDYDTSGCSGTIDHMSWGYEDDYILVKKSN